jgi:type I restriction enzyme S subunit
MNTGWKTVKLDELIEVQNGYAFSSKDYSDSGHFLMRIGNVQNGQITTSDPKYVQLPSDGSLNRFSLVRDDILVSLTGNVGRVGVISDEHLPAALNQRVARITLSSHAPVSREFLLHFLCSDSFREQLTDAGRGSAQQNVSTKDLVALEIPLPPLAEQKRIVAILDEAFKGIDKLLSNARKRCSEALHVFEQERDSFFSNSENNYPETTLSEVTTRLQYGTSEKSDSTGRYVVLRMGNIQDGEIDYEDLKYTSSQEVIDQYCLKPGDVLFNRTNSPQWVGKSAIYRGEMPAVFAGYNIKIHTIADKIDSEFLTFFLNSDRAMSFGRSTFISSVNQANINAEKLRSYRLPLPPLLEQKKIAERFKQIKKMSRDLYTIYDNILTQSNHLKAAILSHAFNGAL